MAILSCANFLNGYGTSNLKSSVSREKNGAGKRLGTRPEKAWANTHTFGWSDMDHWFGGIDKIDDYDSVVMNILAIMCTWSADPNCIHFEYQLLL